MKKSISLTIKVAILLIAMTGTVAIASVAPNLLQTIPLFKKIFNKKDKRQFSYRLKKVSEDLFNLGYIKKNGSKFELTPKGEMVLMKINPSLIKKPKWDGKWRIVCFDVREDSRRKRDVFRFELKSLGFVQMQRSVWVSPYPCEKYIELLCAEHNFGKNIRYILADRISEDDKLRNHFGIKK